MEVITGDDERIKAFYSCLSDISENIKGLIENHNACFNGEYFLTDKELSEILKVSRRTLHEYRNQGLLSYIQIDGKILYRASDIEKLLNDHYVKGWR